MPVSCAIAGGRGYCAAGCSASSSLGRYWRWSNMQARVVCVSPWVRGCRTGRRLCKLLREKYADLRSSSSVGFRGDLVTAAAGWAVGAGQMSPTCTSARTIDQLAQAFMQRMMGGSSAANLDTAPI